MVRKRVEEMEIIPNWHPIFVHFTVSLFSTTVGFFVFSYLFSYVSRIPKYLVLDLEIAGRWCLWVVSIITLGTVLAGLYAYYTVKHDKVSHNIMIIHRNWALMTATTILLLGVWSFLRYLKNIRLSFVFVFALLIVQFLLLTTAWYESELLYRYGLDVMSLPITEGENHLYISSIIMSEE